MRYSATHREKINLLYCLTPVNAYNMGLVKQICVSSNQVANDFNKSYIKLLSSHKPADLRQSWKSIAKIRTTLFRAAEPCYRSNASI